MTPPIKPRGHEPVSGRRTFPLSRIAPNVEGDGFALEGDEARFDLSDTKE